MFYPHLPIKYDQIMLAVWWENSVKLTRGRGSVGLNTFKCKNVILTFYALHLGWGK